MPRPPTTIVSRTKWATLYSEHGGCCAGCFRPFGEDVHVDHVMPLACGGEDRFENLQLMHAGCNATKSDMRPKAWFRRAAAVHPGGIKTELVRHLDPTALQEQHRKIAMERAERGEEPLRMKSVAKCAATSVWAGVVADPAAIGGHYCEDCHVAVTVPPDRATGAMIHGVRSYAVDPERAAPLWSLSEELADKRSGLGRAGTQRKS